MKLDNLIDSLGRADDDFLYEAETVRNQKTKHHHYRRSAVTAAACLLLAAGSILTVEAAGGNISNLLAPVFGIAQTELVEQIGMPVGVSAQSGGYTMSADAVIGDRYNVVIVYTLTRDNGMPIPEQVCFRDWQTKALQKASGGGSLHPVYDREHPEQVKFIERWSLSSPLIGRFVTVRFSDLMVYEGDSQYSLLAEGSWELSYTLRYPDSSVKLPVKNMQVSDRAGKEYLLHKGRISPVGLHIEGKLLNPVRDGTNTMEGFSVQLCLSDGSEILLKDFTKGIRFSEGDTAADCSFEAVFPEPVPLDSIVSLVICDTAAEWGK